MAEFLRLKLGASPIQPSRSFSDWSLREEQYSSIVAATNSSGIDYNRMCRMMLRRTSVRTAFMANGFYVELMA